MPKSVPPALPGGNCFNHIPPLKYNKAIPLFRNDPVEKTKPTGLLPIGSVCTLLNCMIVQSYKTDLLPHTVCRLSPTTLLILLVPFRVLRRIIAEYHLDEIIDRLIGRDSGLFLFQISCLIMVFILTKRLISILRKIVFFFFV